MYILPQIFDKINQKRKNSTKIEKIQKKWKLGIAISIFLWYNGVVRMKMVI